MEKSHRPTLKQLRIANDFSQSGLAEKLKVSRETINRIECGRAKCGELMARRLAEALFCDWRIFVE